MPDSWNDSIQEPGSPGKTEIFQRPLALPQRGILSGPPPRSDIIFYDIILLHIPLVLSGVLVAVYSLHYLYFYGRTGSFFLQSVGNTASYGNRVLSPWNLTLVRSFDTFLTLG
jgi:hypothetical protein